MGLSGLKQRVNNKTVPPVAPSPPAVHTRAVQVLFLPQKTQFHMQTNKHGLPEPRQDKAPAQLHERKQGWKGAWGAQAAQGTPASRPRVEHTWGTLKWAALGNHRQMAMPGSTTAHPGPRTHLSAQEDVRCCGSTLTSLQTPKCI